MSHTYQTSTTRPALPSPVDVVLGAFRLIMKRHRAAASAAHLKELPAYLLADVGLHRYQIDTACHTGKVDD